MIFGFGKPKQKEECVGERTTSFVLVLPKELITYCVVPHLWSSDLLFSLVSCKILHRLHSVRWNACLSMPKRWRWMVVDKIAAYHVTYSQLPMCVNIPKFVKTYIKRDVAAISQFAWHERDPLFVRDNKIWNVYETMSSSAADNTLLSCLYRQPWVKGCRKVSWECRFAACGKMFTVGVVFWL